MRWTVYILQCADGSLYTGITTDLARRIAEHEARGKGDKGGKGARYTQGRGPFQLMYQTYCNNRAEASKKEIAIKALSRTKKMALISGETTTHPVQKAEKCPFDDKSC